MIVSDAAVSTAEKKEVAGRKHLYMSRAYGVTRGRMKGVATPAAFWQRPEQGKNIFSIRRKTMRKFAKIMAVLLALGWLAASCSAKENVVTKWSYAQTRNGKTVTVYMTFYNDGTLEMSMTNGGETEVLNVCPYTGDTRKDGTITIDDGHGTTAEIKGDQLFGEGMVFTKVKK